MRPKLIALLLSGFFPGFGQLYHGQRAKAVAFLIATLLLIWFLIGGSLTFTREFLDALRAFPSASDDFSWVHLGPGALPAIGLLLALWLWSVIDAWWCA